MKKLTSAVLFAKKSPPYKLLLSTGNLKNIDLNKYFSPPATPPTFFVIGFISLSSGGRNY